MKKTGGNTVIITLFFITAIAMFVGAALSDTLSTARLAARSRAYNQAIGVGLGCFEMAYSDWRAICRNNTVQLGSVTAAALSPIATLITSSGTSITGNSGAVISNFSVQPTTPQLAVLSGSATAATGPDPKYKAYYYLTSVTVSVPALSGSVTVNMRRIFEEENTTPWSDAIFYNDDLEINPGAPMVLHGNVHTNGNLYTGYSDLTFEGNTTYSGQWGISVNGVQDPIAFDPLETDHSSDTAESPSFLAGDQPYHVAPIYPFGFDPNSLFSGNNPNTVDGWHELIEPPVAGSTDPLASDRYYNQAYVTVLISSNGTITINDAGGNTVSASGWGESAADKNLYNVMSSALSSSRTPIYDARQQASVYVTKLDISKITAAVANGTLSGFTGIIYIADQTPATTEQVGVELINGQSLPANSTPAGLTIASENPVYIVGDYNTGGSPPSDTTAYPAVGSSSPPPSPTVSTYAREPASIAADAITVLSNSWTNSNSVPSSPPTATNTTVNAAFITGNVPSGTPTNNYSGGAENFPRFLENWGSATFTYYGSMVELFPSMQATKPWGSSNVYGAPTRQWFFDSNFNTVSPPGSLIVTNYIKGRWFLQ